MTNFDVLGTFSTTPVDEETSRKVALLVCSKSKNVDDARALLQILGIIPTPDAKPVHHVVKLGYESTRKHRKKS
jgi:hypothetical protein